MKQLNEFETIEDAWIYEPIIERELTTSEVISILTLNDSTRTLEAAAVNDDKAAGFLMALNNASIDLYDLRNSTEMGFANQGLLTYLASIGAVTEAARDNAVLESNKPVKPYELVEQSQFDWERRKLNTTEISITHDNRDKVITLNEDLPELIAITTWDIEEGFNPVNLGRPTHIKQAGKYRVKLSDKRVNGLLEFRAPIESLDFSVE